jgi:UDP-N-acetylmuramyl pentapeptide phosphotransferase/UDP-N-acetylglucosamine-1-phosphate transferase
MFYFNFAYLAVFACSALICALLILTKKYHMRTRSDDASAVQSAHAVPTPRIGGVAIGVGLVFSIFLVPSAIQLTYCLFVLSLTPVFLAGLAEDLGYGVSPRWRLIAAALSSLLAILLLDAWVARADVPGVDWALTFAPVAIIFTMFATAGVCNAFNLIDGLNGLSAGTGVVTAIGLAAIAHLSGQAQLASISFMLIAALMGFLVFNFPWGKIFLGDAGAYSLGHALAWFSVILMFRVADLTPWAIILIFFWPLADTFFAIYRRRRSGHPTDQPDRLHFHQLVMRLLEIKVLGRGKRRIANPLATLVMLPFVSAPIGFGVLLWDKPLWAVLAVVCFSGLFVGSYMFGVRIAHVRYANRSEASGFQRA